jgi:hypothetical protein
MVHSIKFDFRISRKKERSPCEGKRKQWSQNNMVKAITAVRKNRMDYVKAAKTFNVPHQTLFRVANKRNLEPKTAASTVLGRKTVEGEELESQEVNCILIMEAKFCGPTRLDLRRMAYELSKRNNTRHTFGKGAHGALVGRACLKSFLKRHKELSIRKPTGTSFARSSGFNKEYVDHFFNIIEEFQTQNYPAHRIYNVDETGLTIVQNRVVEVIWLKGKRQMFFTYISRKMSRAQ